MAAIVIIGCFPTGALAQGLSTDIRLNQVGFYPGSSKQAVVVNSPTNVFRIKTTDLSRTVYEGTMGGARMWVSSQEDPVRLADFSTFDEAGTWVIEVPGMGISYPFEIAVEPLQRVAVAAVKGFYYQRASLKLDARYAGMWTRAMGHADTSVRVHASASTPGRPEGTIISAPRGWYDAGDYSKYIVNSGITMGQLFMLYEHYPEYFDAFETNIPESGNGIPDLIDESLWNLRWMMDMQDPDDGGLYHKLTTPNFEPMVMPGQARDQRYVVQKSTPAALDFAAVAALAARVVAKFPNELPGLADSLLQASFAAWNWAQNEPGLRYSQSAVNAAFEPDINTGEYGDGQFLDEFAWAATELYLTTRADSFMYMYPPQIAGTPSVPGWPDVASMALVSLAHHRTVAVAVLDTTELRTALLRKVNQLVEGRRNSPYGIGIGNAGDEFFWGSNSFAANQGFMALAAYRWVPDRRYLDFAVATLDYLLGRNATGYSFVTDHGDKTPMHPHHRPSEADPIVRPVPGLLVGGPNGGRQDGCTYNTPANAPARSYVDHVCSYASNEIAINWQSSLAYLSGAVAAHMTPGGKPLSTAREPIGQGDEAPGEGDLSLDSWPNPSGATATLRFELVRPENASLIVFDLLGRRVLTVLGGGFLDEGTHEMTINTSTWPVGVYMARFEAGIRAASLLMVVAR